MRLHIKAISIFTIFISAMLAACSAADEPQPHVEELTLVLNINDVAGAGVSRAEPSLPASDLEKILQLRVIIAGADGTVEANRLIIPDNSGMIPAYDLRFRVKREPFKTIYLIGNEAAIDGADLQAITSVSPRALDNPDNPDFSNDIINLTAPAPRQGMPVPMSAVYRLSADPRHAVRVGDEYVITYSLSLMRAMVKFVFNFYNLRSVPFSISHLSVENASSSAYYVMPRVESALTGSPAVHYLRCDGPIDIVESGTLAAPVYAAGETAISYTRHFMDHYRVPLPADSPIVMIDSPVTLPAGSTEPVSVHGYFPESRRDAALDGNPYKITIDFENNSFSSILDNLSALPRNTFVVVNVRFNNSNKPIEIEVLPYSQVTLNPGFGQ